MSEFHVNVVRVGPVTKHPNADALACTMVHDYPVITKLGEYAEGDLAVYVPVDSVVPDTAEWVWLDGRRRIKAKRLRGVFSMGLLTRAPEGASEGDDVAARLGITRYEPDEAGVGEEDETDPGWIPTYTDLEGLRRWKTALVEGEDVVITEKIHGANARLVHDGERLWVGSRTRIKRRPPPKTPWWNAVESMGLEAKLALMPGVIIYGEVFGQVQDLKYGIASGSVFRAFDAMDSKTRKYLDYDNFVGVTEALAIPRVPCLYRGAWSPSLRELAEGASLVPGAANVREGFVAKPAIERHDPHNGRVIVKLHGEGYLTRKGG